MFKSAKARAAPGEWAWGFELDGGWIRAAIVHADAGISRPGPGLNPYQFGVKTLRGRADKVSPGQGSREWPRIGPPHHPRRSGRLPTLNVGRAFRVMSADPADDLLFHLHRALSAGVPVASLRAADEEISPCWWLPPSLSPPRTPDGHSDAQVVAHRQRHRPFR